MESVAAERLRRLLAEYEGRDIDDVYLSLYGSHKPFDRVFASLHHRLDSELDWMNYKARNGQAGHFNAENSRDLLDLIAEVSKLKLIAEKAGHGLTLAPEYDRVINGAGWLQMSGGSPIPEGFTPVHVEKYAPVFNLTDAAIRLTDGHHVDLKVIGEGAYAVVHRFVDPNYDRMFARKKLKNGATPGDRERFKREYDLMKTLDFPYILDVYSYNESDDSYTMEYCESTLERYVSQRNNQATFNANFRLRIATQFLYGLNYLHFKGHCHRDLSFRNILLREYADDAVTVKLSDFGLAKTAGSELTKTESEIRGTIIDPALTSFKEFAPVNDIYAVGFVLSLIFTGSKSLFSGSTPLAAIVHKCSHSDPAQRYQTVLEIVRDLEDIHTDPKGAPV